MNLNLHLLRIFYTVVEAGRFARAAERLCISQPAVSKAVKELEHQLDIALLERGAHARQPLQLTVDGQALYEHARGIFALERATVEDLQARRELQRGHLRIGASTTVAGYWLPGYMASFNRLYPHIELALDVANTELISHKLIECEIDVAIVEGEVTDPRLQVRRWQDDPLTVIAPVNVPLHGDPEATHHVLSQQTWLIRESGSGTRRVTEQLLADHNIKPQRTFTIASNEGIARAVAHGLGVALQPTRVVRELLLAGELQTANYPPTAALHRPLYLLQLNERPASPLLQQFLHHLHAHYD